MLKSSWCLFVAHQIAHWKEVIEVTLGQGQLIPGFEAGLMDMSEGEKKTVEIESADAYGEPREEMINES